MVKENPEKITPMMRQYLEVKNRYKDAFIFFRVGDFYELFMDDAVKAASILNIALTSRDKSEKGAVPLCGVPHHAVETYINRMVQEGHKVVLCDQTEDPKFAKGIVRREVVRVITPGTVMDMDNLDPKKNNYIFALYLTESEHGVAFADVSCGDIKYFKTADPGRDVFERMKIKELVILEEQREKFSGISGDVPFPVSFVGMRHDAVDESKSPDLTAVDIIKSYVAEVAMIKDFELKDAEYFPIKEYLFIDENSVRDLEIFEPILKGEKNSSLLDIMDDTVTSMGSRKLRHFLSFPLLCEHEIMKRASAVETFVKSCHLLQPLRDVLKKISDMERITGNLLSASPCPKYLISLKNSLVSVKGLKKIISDIKDLPYDFELPEMNELVELIGKAITDDPPLGFKDGGVIRKEYSAELDELRGVMAGGTGYLQDYEKRERERTGISSLKIGYNRIFGYYIEISKANMRLAPQEYTRKQTLVNAERFITEELKRHEDKVLSASEKVRELENYLFKEFINTVKIYIPEIKKLADEVALIDVFAGFAVNAVRHNYSKPSISKNGALTIENGRHPFVEMNVRHFVPNDTHLSKDGSNIMLITGPNMAGKSTYMRQAALIVIMAQTGSFVPASRLDMPVTDQIFTRIGTSDFLASGKSTFMVEMLETARILNESTARSLVVLDEVGRGTSTYDGMAIAWAVLEHLSEKREKPFVMFSTHYHELTELALTKKNVKNYNVTVKEWKDDIVFLHKVEEGAANKSYGIHVAKLAGLPAGVVKRSQEILEKLEVGDLFGRKENLMKQEPAQLSLFSPLEDKVLKELAGLKLERITPLDAFEVLKNLKMMVGK